MSLIDFRLSSSLHSSLVICGFAIRDLDYSQQIYAETVTPYLGSKPGLANHGYAIHIQTCLEHNPRE